MLRFECQITEIDTLPLAFEVSKLNLNAVSDYIYHYAQLCIYPTHLGALLRFRRQKSRFCAPN